MSQRIAVLTSGGDAPGMNAAIRAVTRTALVNGMEVIGVRRGYEGLLENDMIPLHRETVGGKLLHGGTFLRSARCKEFMQPEGQDRAARNLRENNIDALVVIGGDGSFRGAQELHKRGIKVVGVPATIDNDMGGTDCTIGFDTACNTALDCITKLRDTASSHESMFIVEVMGRHAGYIAVETGVACGAEYIVAPEIPLDIEGMCKGIWDAKLRGKAHCIIVLAEGVMSAHELAEALHNCGDYDVKTVVLGHLQRGGAPSCFDTVLASRLGSEAVNALLAGKYGVMVGRVKGEIVISPLETSWTEQREIDKGLLRLLDSLSI